MNTAPFEKKKWYSLEITVQFNQFERQNTFYTAWTHDLEAATKIQEQIIKTIGEEIIYTLDVRTDEALTSRLGLSMKNVTWISVSVKEMEF